MSASTKSTADNPDKTQGDSRPLAFRSAAAIVLFLVVTIGGVYADLASKDYVFQSLLKSPTLEQDVQLVRHGRNGSQMGARDVLVRLNLHRDVMPGVRFTLSTNPSVAFGGLGWAPPRVLVGGATVLTIGLVLFFFATCPARAYGLQLSLAFILSGALGNFYDRLCSEVPLPGMEPIRNQVRDFVDCSDLHYPWVFNIADVLLVVGVAVLMITWWKQQPPKQPKAR